MKIKWSRSGLVGGGIGLRDLGLACMVYNKGKSSDARNEDEASCHCGPADSWHQQWLHSTP